MDCTFPTAGEYFVSNDRNFHVTMDYDSGYMSHNAESNLDSPVESVQEKPRTVKPVFLSEDALQEIPNTVENPSLHSGNEEYEEKRRLFFNVSEDETVISPSISSNEDDVFRGFGSSDSVVSCKSSEIPLAPPIVINNEMLDNAESSNIKEIEDTGTALTDVTNNLSTNTFKKKLVLVLKKSGEENVYNVKRKYGSSSPEKSFSENDVSSSVDESIDRSASSANMSLDDTLNNPVLTSHVAVNKIDRIQEASLVITDRNDFFGIKTLNSERTDSADIDSITYPCESKIVHSNEMCPGLAKNRSMKICEKLIESKINETVSERKLPLVKDVNEMSPKAGCVDTATECMSPDLFEEEDEEAQETVSEVVHPSKVVAEEKYIHKKDYRLIRRAQDNLKGVLPPRSMTVCQMLVDEMLNRIELNKQYFIWNNEKKDDSNECDNAGESKSLLITTPLEECMDMKFPRIMDARNLGLYYNRSRLSEQLQELCTKYAQRYVGAETQSSCTVFEPETNSSPSKRNRLSACRWSTKSPGRRLSHLARRRITFSSASLASGGSALAGSRARQILVDARKLELLSRRKSPRKTPNRSPKKKTRTPSSSAKKKLALRFRKLTGEIENTAPSTSADSLVSSSKRALFQSPEKKKETRLFLSSTFGMSSFENSPSKKLPTKRALFSSPNRRSPFKRSPLKRLSPFLDKKRKRTDSEESHPASKMPRSMSTMSDVVRSSESKTSLNRAKSDADVGRQPLGELSNVHKKKLQWAVYEALSSQKVTPSHKQFKVFASVLARVTRRLMLNSTQSRPEGSTTERMLRIAKHHVISVVKGKSVEEIIGEYNRQRAKALKPQGYIGVEEYNRLTENVLREKSENVSTNRALEALKGKLVPDNRIERIRKVINFGDDDNR